MLFQYNTVQQIGKDLEHLKRQTEMCETSWSLQINKI